jgi:2-oxoglutarate dehydrogenase E2 component (dihydrolipoamide succinyltransferase)
VDVLSPAVRKLVDDNKLDAAKIPATGKDGRLSKEDVLNYLEKRAAAAKSVPAPAPVAPVSVPTPAPAAPAPVAATNYPGARPKADREERVRMTRLRQRVAERLKQAQNTAAMLTTFNEVDMSALMALRNDYKDVFEKKHGVRLGFMSFFVKACVNALKEIPAVNGEIDGGDIVYKNYYDIGVAVGSPQGLVVPVVRDADQLSFAEVEKAINAYGKKARDGKLTLEDLSGGTFTVSNGGVFGSLLSTPILNPPQSGILGMHKTLDRPVAVNGRVEIRPMMYLALSYDHRIIDGREAVTFLVRVKECIEDPQRLLLQV